MRRTVAVCDPSAADEKRTRYAMSATASPSVSTLSSYNASGENGSAVVGPGGFTTADGCTFMIRIWLGERIQIREIHARVSVRETEVGTSPSWSCSGDRFFAKRHSWRV